MKRDITDEDIRWTMKWPGSKREDEIRFEREPALALLLINEVIFLNNHWWEEKWPAEAKLTTSLNVNCNDVFAWGCADAEEILITELEKLYDMWIKDPSWGPAVWCIQRRNELPQKPVYDAIMKSGIWDLDNMGLQINAYDEYLRLNPFPNKDAGAGKEADSGA